MAKRIVSVARIAAVQSHFDGRAQAVLRNRRPARTAAPAPVVDLSKPRRRLVLDLCGAEIASLAETYTTPPVKKAETAVETDPHEDMRPSKESVRRPTLAVKCYGRRGTCLEARSLGEEDPKSYSRRPDNARHQKIGRRSRRVEALRIKATLSADVLIDEMMVSASEELVEEWIAERRYAA